MIAMIGDTELAILLSAGVVIYLIPLAAFCKIVQRLGWHWALGLLMLVPLVNVIMICVFAWSDPPGRSGPSTA